MGEGVEGSKMTCPRCGGIVHELSGWRNVIVPRAECGSCDSRYRIQLEPEKGSLIAFLERVGLGSKSSQNMHNQNLKSLDPMTCDTEPKSTGLDASTGQSVEKQATGLELQGGPLGDGR